MADAPRSGHVTVTGQARVVQQRMEWMNEGSRSVWNFRLEDGDHNGVRLGTVQVEMRGISIEGSLTDGDTVRVTGRWRNGAIRAEQVQNLTTGALVRAKNYRGLMIAFAALFVVMMGGIVFFAISSSRDAQERREEIQQRQQELMDQQQLGGDVLEKFCADAKDAGLEPPQCE